MSAWGVRRVFVICALLAVSAFPARAQSAEDFYKGKTVTLLITAGAGGMYALNGQVLADHLSRHIPGNPNLVLQYMPGAGGVTGANYLYNVSAKDGSVVGMLAQTLLHVQLLRPKRVRYDAAKFQPIGRITDIVSVIVMDRETTPVKTIQEAMQKESLLGAVGTGAQGYVDPQVLNSVLGTKFKLITGYKRLPETVLAMENGEIHGRASSQISLKLSHADWIESGRFVYLVQFGLEKHPDLPNVPLSHELAKTAEERAMLEFVASSAAIGRTLYYPPGVPAERVAAMRRAFDATMKDPAYLADLKKRQMEFSPMTAAEIGPLIEKTLATPPELVDRIRTALGYNK